MYQYLIDRFHFRKTKKSSIMKGVFVLFILLVQQGIGQNLTEDILFNWNDTYVN
jgi:hypothetical protein